MYGMGEKKRFSLDLVQGMLFRMRINSKLFALIRPFTVIASHYAFLDNSVAFGCRERWWRDWWSQPSLVTIKWWGRTMPLDDNNLCRHRCVMVISYRLLRIELHPPRLRPAAASITSKALEWTVLFPDSTHFPGYTGATEPWIWRTIFENLRGRKWVPGPRNRYPSGEH